MLALESRIMFDGAAVVTASTVTTEQLAQDQADASSALGDAATAEATPNAPTGEPQFTTDDQALFDALAANDISTARQEIVFISSSVREYKKLLDGISPNVEVYVLDGARDGVAQMQEILAGRTGIDAIHLIGEGTEAEMHLGGSFLTQESISTDYAEQFRQIGQSLSAEADLLIYGCNFGRGETGQAAIETLATLTGADVAASTDRTGHVAAYGNWQLEATAGSIETSVVIRESTQADWNHALATFTVTNTNDAGAGSFRQAIIDANIAAGADWILFGIGGPVGVKTISTTSVLPTITDQVFIYGYTQAGSSVNTLAVGNDAVIMIELDGTNAGNVDGLTLGAGSDGSIIAGLIVNNFGRNGIQINSTNNVIAGNWIGLDSTGTLDFGNGRLSTGDGITISANNNTIGLGAPAWRNVLSGNNDEGVDVDPGVTGVVIENNYIGTNAMGTASVANGLITDSDSGGARLDGNGTIFRNNLVSGNLNWGVYVNGTGNVLQGNRIGTDAAGTAGIGNSGPGIRVVGGNNHVIGGVNPGDGNTIAYNTGNGVQVESAASTGIVILGNSIFGNGGLGIDLGNNGVTLNDGGDGDAGANNQQNFPVLTSVQMSNTQATIAGSLNSTANSQYRIEFFANTTPDSSGYGEGQIYLGYVNVTTDGSGNANFSTTLAVTGTEGSSISATATRSNVTFTTFTDTSEFAQNAVAVVSAIVDLNSGPTIVTTGPFVGSTTSTSDLVSNGNFGAVASGAPPAPWVESGAGGNGSVIAPGGDGRYRWTAGNAVGTTISQALTVPGSTSNTTVSTSYTATSTTVVTTTVDSLDELTSISFDMSWQNADTGGANNNRLIISYNGVTYATFETFQGPPANAAGLIGNWTYSNGASGPATTLSVVDESTGPMTSITINLPAGITVSGDLAFLYTQGSTGSGSDDLAIDNMVATSTKTTTTTVTTVTTTSDTADNNWTATYTENGPAVSIADTDSSIFDADSTNMVSAAITLTNPAAGDRLLVNGSAAASGTLASGISWTRTDTLVTLSGLFTKADYADAIELIQFENTTDTPSTTPRTITVTANDGTTDSNPAIATITVTPVNDAPTITALADQVILEDTTTGALPFTVGDVETPGSLTVTAVSSNTTIIPNGNLTLVDLGGGNWTIDAAPALNQNGGPVTITVTVDDGTTTTNETFDVTVTPALNSPPTIITNAGSTVIQGLTDFITSSELQVTDTDNTPAQVIYTVVTVPLNGHLELTTAPGVSITSFSQADINAGRLLFVHNGAVSASDSFSFTVSDGAGGTIGTTTFNFTVTPFFPPPPPPPPGPGPDPDPGPVPGPPGPVPGGTGLPGLPPPVLQWVEGSEVVGATDEPVKRVALSSRTFARVEQPDIWLEEPRARWLEPLSLPVEKLLAVGHNFADRLTMLADDLDRAMGEREHQRTLMWRLASFSGITLSAGFLAWILRGGSLLASFLVSIPTWRRFDPLPVLKKSGRDRKEHDRKVHNESAKEGRELEGLSRVLRPSASPAKESRKRSKGGKQSRNARDTGEV